MKAMIATFLVVVSLSAAIGCSQSSENVVLPAPELTLEDYERMAAEEEAEQKAISKMP